MNKLHVIMPDEIYVGNYYKLYALPSYGSVELYEYEVDSDCVKLVAEDTIKVVSEGVVTVTAKAENMTAYKTIECKKYPSIKRRIVNYEFTDVESFKNFIEDLREPTEVVFINDASMIIDETIYIPYGVVLNFNNKNISIGSSKVERNTTFVFSHDHCGVRNLNLTFKYPEWSEHPTADKYLSAHTLFQIFGSYFKLENFKSMNRQTAGISVARWGHGSGNFYNKNNTWYPPNISNGYINQNGNVVEENDVWYSTNFINLPDLGNGYFSVGYFANFLQHHAKTYGIAFYDTNNNFIGVKYGCQFYRGYSRPEGATKCKLMLWNGIEPQPIKVGTSGGMDWDYYLYVTGTDNTREVLFKNCKSLDNESGMIDFVGDFGEINIIECKAKSGHTNGWSIDFEDGWMGMKDVVIKSCLFSRPYFHSVQGLTLFNSIIGTTVLASWTNGDVFENVEIVNGSNFINTSQYTTKLKANNCVVTSTLNEDYVVAKNLTTISNTKGYAVFINLLG